jgi:hypothetical protein
VTGQFVDGEIWTAAILEERNKTFMWHARTHKDALKRNLYWNKIYTKNFGCVYLELFNDSKSRQDDPRLGMANCEERKPFICEANITFIETTKMN